jgi:cytochrome b561
MHKSFGVVLLALILARLLWRLVNVTPKEPDGTPTIQRILARGMHWVLYALMFAQPISGILMSQAAGYPVSAFGAVELPMLLEKDASLAQTFRDAHGTIWILLVLAVIGHAGAALHHHFIRKDEVMKQMGFGSQPAANLH